MSQERIVALFQRVETEESELKEWIALMLTGAIVADKHLEESETPYLETLIQVFGKDHPISQNIEKVIQSKEIPHLEAKTIDPAIAEEIFECMLEICGGDHELHLGEIQYLRDTGSLLGIDYLELQYLIKHTGTNVKTASFHGMLEDLNEEQRYWLAMVILNMIFSDEHISVKEGVYLGDLDDLLKERPDILRTIKINPRQLLSDTFPDVSLEPALVGRVIKYLLGLAVSDGVLEQTEEQVIRHVAETIGYAPAQLEEDITRIKSFQNK